MTAVLLWIYLSLILHYLSDGNTNEWVAFKKAPLIAFPANKDNDPCIIDYHFSSNRWVSDYQLNIFKFVCGSEMAGNSWWFNLISSCNYSNSSTSYYLGYNDETSYRCGGYSPYYEYQTFYGYNSDKKLIFRYPIIINQCVTDIYYSQTSTFIDTNYTVFKYGNTKYVSSGCKSEYLLYNKSIIDYVFYNYDDLECIVHPDGNWTECIKNNTNNSGFSFNYIFFVILIIGTCFVFCFCIGFIVILYKKKKIRKSKTGTRYLSTTKPLIQNNNEIKKPMNTTKGVIDDFIDLEGINIKQKQVKSWFIYNTEFDDDICETYFKLLIENGFDTINTIKNITQKELQQIGIHKLGHRKQIISLKSLI